MNTDLMFSSDLQDWRTPPEVLELVRKVGPIALDPATSEDNPCRAQSWFCAGRSDHENDNGLTLDWRKWADGGLAYCNSPYGRSLSDWAAKISDEGMRGCEVISLTPARTDTKWFRKMVTADAMCFWSGRIKFISFNPLTKRWERGAWNKKTKTWTPDSPAAFPSLVCYWGKKADKFREIFRPYGWMPL